MKDAIKKAGVLIEALPYIQRFRDRIVVIKFGGSAMEAKAHRESILTDVAFMECVGMLPVIVHGGGKEISRGLEEKGLKAEFLHGLRVTGESEIEVVEDVLKNRVNPRIVEILKAAGAEAEGLNGADVFRARKKTEKGGHKAEALDWGFVGEPTRVLTGAVKSMLKRNVIPVISPLGKGKDGRVYNINADIAAAAAARSLVAAKLVFLSDVPGLLRKREDPESIIHTVRSSEVEKLAAEGIITGGMLPKVASGVGALEAGVEKIHIVDGRMRHSLLLEIFTDRGVGTEIVRHEGN
ncbi:MAG: acetylglutamate kinase [Kiritimatiellia bacterium]